MLLIHLFFALLPYLSLLLTIWLCRLRQNDAPFFLNVIQGATLWSLVLWLETNALSWLNCITGPIIASFWLCYFLAAIGLILRYHAGWRRPSLPTAKWPACFVLLILVATLLAGLAYPPNNYDVLTYHMPRVAQWLQNHSMAPWVTSIDRQIGMAPFNAMIALQSYAPYRWDYCVNLGQWLAFCGCLFGVQAITAKLGGNKLAQACAVIFAATLPSAIIQASNTESCLLVSFYLLSMAYMYVLWRADSPKKWGHLCFFGANLGLAILSKGSAYPIALPFVSLVAWYCLRSPRQLLLPALVAAPLVVALNVPHFARAVQGVGSVVASAERNILIRPTPATFTVNALYHFIANEPFLLHFGGLEMWKNFTSSLGIEQDDKSVFPWLGLDGAEDTIKPCDPTSPNPLHALFVLFVAVALFRKKITPPWHYATATYASFFFFILLLTWHPWVARIQISLFFLLAPMCGMLISAIHMRWLYYGTISALFIYAILPTFFCVERPLGPYAVVDFYRHGVNEVWFSTRESRFFNNYPNQMDGYMKAADLIAAHQPENVGMRIGNNALEYPLWSLLNNRMPEMPYMYHAISGQIRPGYIFEFVRNGENTQQPVRVFEVTDGHERVIYPAPGQAKLQ